MDKLYVVVRADLPPGMQIAQACHALRQFTAHHPEVDRAWYEGSNNLVVLQVPGEDELFDLLGRAGAIPITSFREPDLDDEVTAVAIGPEGCGLVSQLPLALRAVPEDLVQPLRVAL